MAVDSCRHLAHHRLLPNERHMKKMYAMLCLFGFMAGCNASEPPPLTPEQYKEQYEARQAAAEAAAKAKLKPNTVIIPKGPGVPYERELTIICVRGVKYYYAERGWSTWFTPVMSAYGNRDPEPCSE